jgi:Uma2 family endonuclease
MTLAEYEALPEEKPYLQYWDGVVVQKAVPKRKHGRLQYRILRRVVPHAQAAGGDAWPEAHIWFAGHGYLVPDVVYYAPGKAQGDDERSLPPTLAVEIRSPDETMTEQRAKCRLMRENGVDVCWLIDPARRVAETFEGVLDGEPVNVLESVFLPGFTLSLDELFAELDG